MQFTRYLYIKDEVQYSLLISLLRSSETKNVDEVLFWAYELYFSGWKEETFSFIQKIYTDFYEQIHPTLKRIITKKNKEWRTDGNPCHLGTILHNIAKKTYSTDIFLQKYIPSAMQPENHAVTKRQNYTIIMLPEELQKYLTLELEHDGSARAWQVLQNECRYSTYRTSHRQSIFVFRRCDVLFRFREKWQYYAAMSTPIWSERIQRFGGILNHIKKTVDFPTEEMEEEFCKWYDYEPDEQSKEIIEKCVGLSTKHGELRILRIQCPIDFSGNRILEYDISEEELGAMQLPPPPPSVDYFAQ